MQNEVINKYFGSFSRKVFTLLKGTVMAQLITLAVSPILTRLYEPSDFGRLALFIAISSLIGMLGNLGLDRAIVASDNTKEASRIFVFGLIFSLVVQLVCLSIFFLTDLFQWATSSNLGNSPAMMLAVLGSGFLLSINFFLTGWYNHSNRLNRLSKSRVVSASTTSAGKLSFFFSSISAYGLIWGHIIGQLAGLVALGRSGQISFQSLRSPIKGMRKYWRFPVFEGPRLVVDYLRTNLILFSVSSSFSISVTGYYAMAVRMVMLPVDLLSYSVGHVLLQTLSTKKNEGEPLLPAALRILRKLAVIVVPFGLVVAILAPDIFAIAFGEDWRISGVYSRALVPWLIVDASLVIFSAISTVVNRQAEFLVYKVSYNLVLPAIVLLAPRYGYDAEATFSIVGVFGGIAGSMILLRLFYQLKRWDQQTTIKES